MALQIVTNALTASTGLLLNPVTQYYGGIAFQMVAGLTFFNVLLTGGNIAIMFVQGTIIILKTAKVGGEVTFKVTKYTAGKTYETYRWMFEKPKVQKDLPLSMEDFEKEAVFVHSELREQIKKEVQAEVLKDIFKETLVVRPDELTPEFIAKLDPTKVYVIQAKAGSASGRKT